MSEKAKNALAIYKSVEGQEEGVGDWLEIDQDRINMFAMFEDKNGQGVRSLLYRRQNSEVMVTCNHEKICNY